MTVTGDQIWERSKTQWGKPYRFGVEITKHGDSLAWYFNAPAWDCAEYTEMTHASFGIYLPDGSGAQGDFVKRIPIKDAVHIRGALLGHYPKGSKPGHVVISEGDGVHTSEAMGRKYGVLRGKINGRGFTWAGTVPGVTYVAHSASPPVPPPPGSPAALQQAIFFAKLFRLGSGDPTALTERSPGGPDAVKFAQAGVNNWYDRFARLVGGPNPPDIPVNGQWDRLTRDHVNLLQAITKHNELGVTGPLFWEAVFPTRPGS